MPSATKSDSRPLSASFRDPAGQLIRHSGRLLRAVYAAGIPNLQAFQASATVQRLSAAGRIVSSTVLEEAAGSRLAAELRLPQDATIVEHGPIEFPSFPYEWPPEMLAAAAELTLDLAEGLLEEGLGLKDATPFNVLFRGAQPVFVDVLSVEPRDSGDPVWRPYAQFVRTFLLPLLAYQQFRLGPDQVFTGRREGLSPEDVYRMSGRLRRLLPPILGYATIPTWLGSRSEARGAELYEPKRMNPEKARFVVASRLRSLRASVRKASGVQTSSHWTDYSQTHPSYTAEQVAAKQRFVSEFLAEAHPGHVLDIGCNTGEYSVTAAHVGANVVALDADPAVVGRLYRRASAGTLPILPLVVNIGQPSPATGWRNGECASFLDRAARRFDAVLMLAILHHLLVTDRVPLDSVVDLAADLTRDWLVIEFIAPDDPMFRHIVRGREELHRDLDASVFAASLRRRFDVVRSAALPGSSRTMYLARRRS
ncbi:MAG: class I SAM-dependent methyltransferase [Acidobacteriia bacterium]|nr:class I SAM-dependent methyltransferase [Terriglobia bacterium]